MWQAEIRVDLDAIRTNVAQLVAGTKADVMAVVKGDGYGHGLVPAARAALAGGAPGLQLHRAVQANVDLSAGSVGLLKEIAAAARVVGRPARTHLKIDTGLSR